MLERDLHPVYRKTGNQAVADDRRIETTKHCQVFDREDFLYLFNGYEGRKSILVDFKKHPQKWEDESNSYAEWTKDTGREAHL